MTGIPPVRIAIPATNVPGVGPVRIPNASLVGGGQKSGGRVSRPKRFDDGGAAGGGSKRPNDPGNEIAAANKGRKSTVDWIRDEVLGGTKPAYARGGRQRQV